MLIDCRAFPDNPLEDCSKDSSNADIANKNLNRYIEFCLYGLYTLKWWAVRLSCIKEGGLAMIL